MFNAPVTRQDKVAAVRAAVVAEAGLKDLDHYDRKLPKWRYRLREWLLPALRSETPYLSRLQDLCRSPFLDSYFAITANLGTHTFFMTALPILFWCGYTSVGRALVHMLALGVFWSGFIKDLLCLPRPLSPPLQRITMSGSAALEYGFPSTHSTNAVSVAAYYLYFLHSGDIDLPHPFHGMALAAGYGYAISIIFGRVYCGMHGFLDVVIGSALGALFAGLQVAYGDRFDAWIGAESWNPLLVAVGLILVGVRFHPEPADNCPCFDDSVAFAGVLIGINLGHWHFSSSSFAMSDPVPATVPFDLGTLGWTKTVLRMLVGVVIIFIWRAVMKPLLLRSLPPIFRLVEQLGLTLPRRFFTRASQYKRVPPLRKDDNVIPSAWDISATLTSFRHSRKRAVSVGPQSEADAREFIAYREHRRKDSQIAADSLRPRLSLGRISTFDPPSPLASPMESDEKQLGHNMDAMTNGRVTAGGLLSPNNTESSVQPLTPPASDSGREEERQDKEMFLALEKPRVRYDVEVITKLVVYGGIAWLAVEGNPILFELIGLGMGVGQIGERV